MGPSQIEGFISDEEMAELVAQPLGDQPEEKAQPRPEGFISDEEMTELSAPLEERKIKEESEVPSEEELEAAKSSTSKLDTLVRSTASGLTGGYSDEAAAKALALYDVMSTDTFDMDDLDQLYAIRLRKIRAADKAAEGANPKLAAAGEVVGTALGIAGTGMAAKGLLSAAAGAGKSAVRTAAAINEKLAKLPTPLRKVAEVAIDSKLPGVRYLDPTKRKLALETIQKAVNNISKRVKPKAAPAAESTSTKSNILTKLKDK